MQRPSMDEYRMWWGFLLLIITAVLIGIIALGHVEEQTSAGLKDVIDILGVLGGGWVVWAFSNSKKDKE